MWKKPWLWWLVLAASLAPFVWLAWKWTHNQLGINSIEYVARYTGRWAIYILLASLAITPLRKIPGLSPLIKFRRMLGLVAFLYGVFHALHYFGRDVQWNWQVIEEDLTFRRFFIAGAVSLVLMIPLAATSTNAAVRWMGGKRWQLLHRLVYPSALAAVVHNFWMGKSFTERPVIYAVILAGLLGARLVFRLLKASR